MVAAIETAPQAVDRFLRELTRLLGMSYRDGIKRIANLTLQDSGNLSGFFLGNDGVYQFAVEGEIVRFRPVRPTVDSAIADAPIPIAADPYGQGFLSAWSRADARPKCRIGYSCGEGCISKKDECRIRVSAPRHRQQLQTVKDLAKLVGKLGGKPLLAVLVGIGAAGVAGFTIGSAIGGFVGAKGAQRPAPPPPDPPRRKPQRDRTDEPIRRTRKPKAKPAPVEAIDPPDATAPEAAPPDPAPAPLPGGKAEGVTRLNPDDIRLAPKLFQYKLPNDISSGAAAELRRSGTTGALRDVETWNPDLAGKMLVWQVPEDFSAEGEDYRKGEVLLVHGHHRMALAKRASRMVVNSVTGETIEGKVDSVEVEFIAARTTREAKVIGAMQNIAQGAGTARDAASIFRELKINDPAQLKSRGISLKGAIAEQGLGLAGLNDRLWSKVASLDTQEMSLRRASYIGQIRNDDLQDEVWLNVRRRANATDEYVRSLSLSVQHQLESGRVSTETDGAGGQGALFDTGKLVAGIADRAEVDAYIETQITRESNFWKRAASPVRMAEILARESAGEVDVDRAEQVSLEVAAVRHLYRSGKFVSTSGDYEAVNAALDRLGMGLRELRRSTTSKKRIEDYKASAWQEIRELLVRGIQT